MRKCSYVMGITWEVRNSNVLQMNKGAVVCSNHQSAIDILSKSCVIDVVGGGGCVCRLLLQGLDNFDLLA